MQDILIFLQNHLWLTSAAVVILIALTILEFIKAKRNTHELSPTALINLINHEDAAVVDLRHEDQYRDGHIIGALSIPLDDLEKQLKKIEKFKDQPLVLVCAVGTDSAKAILQLQSKGFQKAHLLTGGIRAWKMAEMPTIKE